MFTKILLRHNIYYLMLAVVFCLSFLLAYSSTDRIFQIGVIVATTFFYVLWGIMHHLLNHDLHLKIVVEYILIGGFGLAMIFFILSVNGNH